jgi:DNA (cytosine-5)-methyltransferase 1
VVGALSARGYTKYTDQEFVRGGQLVTSHDVIRTGKNAEVVKRNGDDTYYIEDVERGPVKAGGAGGAPPRSDRLPLITYNVRPEFGNGADLRVDEADVHPTLAQQTHLPGYDRGIRVQEQATVRRLTPLECERLMGWPEVDGRGWTDVPWNKKDHAPDSRRYAACGNGVVAPVAFWIGARLAEVLSAE